MNRKIAPNIVDALHFDLQLKPYKRISLQNGVPVYMVDAGTQDVMKIEWVFYAGNYFEEKKAVAATTNFMLKNGTKNRTAFQINEDFEFYGAYCNRGCYSETAVVSLHSLTKHLPALLPVVQDMLMNSTMPEEELAIYKQNSIQRLQVNLQKCEYVAERNIHEMLYGPNHPYGRKLMPEDINAVNVEDLRSFYEQYYLNGQCVIFVAGKLPDNIESLLNEYFGSLSFKAPTFELPEIPIEPSTVRQQHIINDPNGVQGAIRMATPFPNRHHPDFKAAMVLNTVFGGFFGSRLMSNIREDKGYTYGIYSYIQNNLTHCAWMIATEAGIDVCKATIEEVYKEMRILQDEIIEEQELLLVKNYLLGSILGDLDGPFHIIGRWKNIILHGLSENYFDETIKVIKNITPEELQTLSQRYLQPEAFYELLVQ